MTKKIILLFIFSRVFVSMGNAQVTPDYLHDFYNDRIDKIKSLISGDQAPLDKENVQYVTYFDFNEDYVLNCTFHEDPEGEIVDMATYSGKIKKFRIIGTLGFELQGQPTTLKVYQNVKYAHHPLYGRTYFIPFKDATSGESTYGGGRYIDIDKSCFSQQKVVLDFNKAYNPWCAYSSGYNCPVPPVDNELNLAIEAGEKAFPKDKYRE